VIDPAHHEKYAGFEPEKATFALVPGSRVAEIELLWRPMQQIALRLKEKYRQATFVAVAVDAKRQQLLKETQIPGFECQYSVDSVNKTAAAVDFSIVTSGSATLEIAAAGCPMAVMYQSNRVLWYLFGWIIKTKYLSLVNILTDRELVPEFMPNFNSIDPIVASIDQLLLDKNALGRISSELTELTKPLAEKRACEEVAKMAVEMLLRE